MIQHEILKDTISDVKDLKQKVTSEFYYKDEKTLTHKPAPDKWSAVQCFEHINLSNRHYIDLMLKSLDGPKDPSASRRNFNSGLIGGYMIKSMRPKNGVVTNPMRTFTKVKPLADRVEGAIVTPQKVFTDFFQDMNDFEKLCKEFEAYNIQKIKIESLIGKFIKFRVGDCLPFLMAHTNRHIIQAINAMNSALSLNLKQ